MTEKQEIVNAKWLCVILVLLMLFGAVTFVSFVEISRLKHEQVLIYTRINDLEKSLRTKDIELERYLVEENISSGAE